MRSVSGLLSLLILASWMPLQGQETQPEATPTQEQPGQGQPPALGTGAFVMDFLEYRLDLQDKMSKSWAKYLSEYQGPAELGYVAFSYYVNARGEISLIQQTAGKPDSPLVAIAMNAIADVNRNPLPVPDTVKTRYPQGFFNKVAFQIR